MSMEISRMYQTSVNAPDGSPIPIRYKIEQLLESLCGKLQGRLTLYLPAEGVLLRHELKLGDSITILEGSLYTDWGVYEEGWIARSTTIYDYSIGKLIERGVRLAENEIAKLEKCLGDSNERL